MTTVAPDMAVRATGRRTASGLAFALVSALSFGLSGPLARGLMDTGWTAGAATLARVAIAAAVVVPLGAWSLRGRWQLLRDNAGLVTVYGLLAIAGAQFCYFSAVTYMQVGPALLIEYTAPAAVVVWLWLRHGQRPGRVTLLGAAVAALGLVLVLDLLTGADLHPVGVLWALAAMVGATSYFLISADERNGLPSFALGGAGLVVATLVLGALGAVGLLPLRVATEPVTYAGHTVTWWLPLLALGVVTAGVSYLTGIAAGRRLGSRVASFVALLEVLAAVGFAWLLLAELPGVPQLVGGVLVLVGVVAVKLGERRVVGTSTSVAPETATAA